MRASFWAAALLSLPQSLAAKGCGPGPFFLSPPFDEKHSRDVCKTCVTNDCQWCPVSQSCGSKGFFGSASCMGDLKPVDSGNGCGQTLPWMDEMEEKYGKDLAPDGAYPDVMRCLQGRMERWELWPDKELPGWRDNKISDFSCKSVVIREAVMASLGRPHTARSLQERQPEISFCLVYRKLFPSKSCEVWSHLEEEFSQLRSGEVTEDLHRSLQKGPLRPLNLDEEENFLTTWDNKFTIQVNFDEVTLLTKLLQGQGGRSLKDHLRSNRNSLIQRLYGLVRVKVLDQKAYCLVMANEAYELEARLGEARRYDLKGKSRSPRRKSTNAFVGLNGDFREREQNMLLLKNWQCKSLRKAMSQDISWLQSHSLSEYSLFVEVVQPANGCGDLHSTPLCNYNEQREAVTTLALVDYVKDRRGAAKFGGQMLGLVDEICIDNKKEAMDSWQIYLILGCFSSLLILGAFLGWKYGAAFLRSDRPHELRDVELTTRGVRPA